MEIEAWLHEEPDWSGWAFGGQPNELLREHVFVTWVASLHHHAASQGDAFAPGAALKIVPDPDNKSDPLAVSVFDESGLVLGGHLPGAVVAGMARRENWCGLSMLEHRQVGQRVHLWFAVSYEPLILRQGTDASEPTWASRELRRLQDSAKRETERADERDAWTEAGDPMEQMRKRAADLDDP